MAHHTVLRVFTVEHLGCAHCAARMEAAIAALPEVHRCTLTYATRQLRIEAEDPEALLPRIQEICASIEAQVRVVPLREPVKSEDSSKADILRILWGAGTLVIGKLLEHLLPATAPLPCHWLALAVFILGYLVCGWGVLTQAAKSITKGHALDENFLMGIATLGAFVIGEFGEALGVMLFYRVGEYFEDRAVEKSRSSIMAALDLRPEVVHKLHGDHTHTIPAEEAVPGDLLLLRPGDRVPLDGVVMEGTSTADTSAITGESVPIALKPGDRLISGWVNQTGVVRMRVEKPLSESMVTRILNSVESAAASKPQIDRFITRFCRYYTPIVVVLALVTAILPSLFTGDWWYWVKTALTFLVISCPCALVLSVPLAFFAGIGLGSKNKLLFKGGSAMEALCKVKVVAMDKTGTLTQGTFSLRQLLPREGVTEQELLELAAFCEQGSNHPIARSIQAAAQGLELPLPQSVTEVPGQGVLADGVCCGSRRLLEEQGIPVPSGLSCTGTEVLVSKQGRYLGAILIDDALKPETAQAIQSLKARGLKTVMLTGDAGEKAKAVADELGLDEYHSRLLPQDKLERLQELRQAYGPVLYVGDGINDAPVLAGADVGAAMGSGADAAIEAADLVFMTARMDAVPQAISIARRATAISRQNVVLAVGIKALVILLGLLGWSNLWLAVFADTGVAMLCILNSIRLLYQK